AVQAGRHPTVIETYRGWANDRIEQVTATEEGRGEKMYPVAVAAILVVMMCRADREEHALPLPVEGSQLDASLMKPVAAFNAKVAKGHKAQLRTAFRAYPIQKAESRLGGRLAVRRPRNGAWLAWLPAAQWSEVLDVLSEELVERRALSSVQALGAVD